MSEALLAEHLGYLSDSSRLRLYESAIAKTVSPGDVVADLGCGTAVLGIISLRAGASKLYAIDSSPILEAARKTVGDSGFADRCEFLSRDCRQAQLPELVDVLVCDHVGYFGLDYGILALLSDARRRFLRPGGTVIPTGVELMLCAVESERNYAQVDGWHATAVPREFHWIRQRAVNTKYAVSLQASELLATPTTLGRIDFREDAPALLSWSARLQANRDGLLHGLAGWFDCELADGIRMTNSPVAEGSIKRPQAFFPLQEPLPVRTGDVLSATVKIRPAEGLIAWQVELESTGKAFRHSTWQGGFLATADVLQRKPEHVVILTPAGRARLIVLEYCDGHRTMSEIEQAVIRDHPGLFPSTDEISRFVATVLGKDTE